MEGSNDKANDTRNLLGSFIPRTSDKEILTYVNALLNCEALMLFRWGSGMDTKEIRGLVKQYGYVGLHGRSEGELTSLVCDLAKELEETELRLFSGTFVYRETGAKTEWEILDNNEAQRLVWIIKKVTRFADTDLEKVEKERFTAVDREIADQFIAVLNSQKNGLL
jgi:hypothetical protein